ncbi:MAG: hypothetical protein DMF87_17325 [Acidobacteria bacterium]|nr:MAG: hypothetical protein DMF88_01675 [Acidobacteriota bacterium]PYR76796.1 MAG: hypothetical protein DMF87_17325 [Acidobacteriota bacterium]
MMAQLASKRLVQAVVSNGFGYGAWWGGGSYTTSVHTYVQGTLIVDLYDAKTKKMVWRGTATGTRQR